MLRYLRTFRGLTQHQLAKKAGVSANSVCKFEGQSDVPRPEYAVRLLEALDSAKRLTTPERSRYLQVAGISQHLIENSPIGAFVRECCVVGDGQVCWCGDLFAAWCQWAIQNKMKPGNHVAFGVQLRNACPRVIRGRGVKDECITSRYIGIGLKSQQGESEEVAAVGLPVGVSRALQFKIELPGAKVRAFLVVDAGSVEALVRAAKEVCQ